MLVLVCKFSAAVLSVWRSEIGRCVRCLKFLIWNFIFMFHGHWPDTPGPGGYIPLGVSGRIHRVYRIYRVYRNPHGNNSILKIAPSKNVRNVRNTEQNRRQTESWKWSCLRTYEVFIITILHTILHTTILLLSQIDGVFDYECLGAAAMKVMPRNCHFHEVLMLFRSRQLPSKWLQKHWLWSSLHPYLTTSCLIPSSLSLLVLSEYTNLKL